MEYLHNPEDDVVINMLPLSFDYGLYQLLMSFQLGGTLVDDIINCAGEKVAPKQVENVLYGLDGVVEAAVNGVPDEILGQAISAFVIIVDNYLK